MADSLIDERTKFKAGFQRSNRGNLWRTWDNATLTVFKRDDGRFAWCIAGSDGQPRYSEGTYGYEAEALESLVYACGLGEPCPEPPAMSRE
jgi:hypothetical protein